MIASTPKPTTVSYRQGSRLRYTRRGSEKWSAGSRQGHAQESPMSDSLVSPFAAGFACRCPRCGEGALYSGFLKVAPRCESCDLDLKFADSGDGPAVFVIFAVAPIV